jgi:hypothetical protein
VTYGRLPSEIVGVTDQWAAYQFDLCVAQFGAWVEGKLSERDKAGKPKHTLAKLLDDGEAAQQFAALHIDPSTLRKVRVKEDGTWDED